MSRKRAILGTNVVPGPICRGNPRRPSAAMNCAIDAQPLGRSFSNVTKQKYVLSRVRPSDSLDSISDEEINQEKRNIIRSHVRPNKNVDAFAEIRNPRIPKAPHDPSKPAIMKHRDLPSFPVSNHLKGGSVSRSLSTTDSSAFSSSDDYVPFNKIRRVMIKAEMQEEPVNRSVKNEHIAKTSMHCNTTSMQEMKKEVIEMNKEMEVEMPKTQIASIVPKKEIKEDMNDNSEGETNSESSDEDEEDEMEESMHSRLKMKKSRPAEELAMQRKTKERMKTEVKMEEEECEIITLD
ncbi:hypothetical protein PRIPAC_76735 [Pristionchus pacificus]|uniref:Uncharacterized protein n=1 Tax=Pristionchus pacificus TaxID=54126 RepID=A0A454Y598_PRIPA|nr:hypothetical protein PRIPAC_76735 [Pristionchus pacificus]|eukprot:PDM75224.1 hypothetical protein PRIPAC_43418 [Pristionchus pacificus]